MFSSATVVMLVIAFASIACTETDADPAPATSPRSRAPTTGAAACPNEDAVARNDDLRSGGVFSGDVTGDGSEDRVSIRLDPEGASRCAAFLVVDSGDSVMAEPIAGVGSEGAFSDPTLNSLAEINREGGLEVVVNEAAGASTQFVGVFTLDGDGLARVMEKGGEAELWTGASQGLFPFGGSVSHIEAVDCAGGGVVVTRATPAEGRGAMERGTYAVVRRVLEIEGATLTTADIVRAKAPIDELAERFSEFETSPFGSC
jgi:hypothetical protein